jgi:cytochrome P450
MLHDKRYYKEPYKFDPSRYLPELSGKPAEMDPRDLCFGFGRRICPGINLADDSLYITTAMVCAVFDVKKFVKNGVVMEPEYEKTAGLITHPAPFRVSISPRSDRAVELIRGEA